MTVLVIGRGLLGGQVEGRLRARREPVHTVSVPWERPDAALVALLDAAGRAAASDPHWRLMWCAGAGVMATPVQALQAEVDLFRGFLAGIEAPPGALVLASSCGGVYAGSEGPPFTEDTVPRALAPYGKAKLAMEQEARALAGRGSRILLARISNLYGPGQDLSKPQGLISQLCVTHVTGRPLGVYASMDTLRDYIFSADAAALIVACLDRLAEQQAGSVVTKIVANGNAMSIGSLVDASMRAFRRRPRLVQRAADGRSQVRDLRVRSRVWTDLDGLVRTPIVVGLRATADDVLARHARGQLFTVL